MSMLCSLHLPPAPREAARDAWGLRGVSRARWPAPQLLRQNGWGGSCEGPVNTSRVLRAAPGRTWALATRGPLLLTLRKRVTSVNLDFLRVS